MDKVRSERGSALLLVPAFLLIFVMIAGFVVDWSVAFLGEREVANAAAAGANDAAAAALLGPAFQTNNEVILNRSRAEMVAAESVRRRDNGVLRDVQVTTELVGPNKVRVTVHAKVSTIFTRALPYGTDTVDVEATATATARLGSGSGGRP